MLGYCPRSTRAPIRLRATQSLAGLVGAILCVVPTGCSQSGQQPVRLGETAAPPLAAHPTGKLVPNRIAWSVNISRAFNQGATRWALGHWVVITQTDTTAGGQPRVTVQAVMATSGKLTRPHSFLGVIQAPFALEHAGRPLVLLMQSRAKQVRLRAIDAATGRTHWEVPAALGLPGAAGLRFKPAGADGDLLIGSLARAESGPSPCALCALDPATGRLRWTLPGKAPKEINLVGSVKIGPRSIATFLGDNGIGKYFVVDRATGEVLASAPWTRKQEDNAPTSFLALRTGFLAMAAPDEQGKVRVRAIDDSGRIRWDAGVRQTGVVIATPTSVALPTLDGAVEARDLLTGKRRWVISAGNVAASELTLTINAGTRVTGAVSTLSITLDGRTGKTVWTGPYAAITPEAWNGHTYFGWATDGRLTAYASNGRPPVGADISVGDVPIFVD